MQYKLKDLIPLERILFYKWNLQGSITWYYNSIFFKNRFYKELSHTSAESLQPGFMGNPINAYHFIRRMHVTWREIISDIDCETCALSYPQKGTRFYGTTLKNSSYSLLNKYKVCCFNFLQDHLVIFSYCLLLNINNIEKLFTEIG